MEVVFGGPGTGKTTYLIERVSQCLEAGVLPQRIAYMAFTRKAAQEAKRRTCEELGLQAKQLPYFSTLHSMAYRELGLHQGCVMGGEEYQELSDMLGVHLTAPKIITEGPPILGNDRSALVQVLNYARTTARPLEEVWRECGSRVNWWELVQLAKALYNYKQDRGKMDFTDMLEEYELVGQALPVDVGIIDEAQDLTRLQWDVAWRALSGATDIIAAGDDDQAIYRWSGADVTQFQELARKPDTEVKVLGHSHRLPRKVFALAQSVARRISVRQPKDWEPADREGEVRWVAYPQALDLTAGEWLLLARNAYHLQEYERTCRLQGVSFVNAAGPSVKGTHVHAIKCWESLRQGRAVYGSDLKHLTTVYPPLRHHGFEPQEAQWTRSDLGLPEDMEIWHDALVGIPIEQREYYLAILRRGEKLTTKPRVRVATIHSVKGGEADNVVLRTDMTSRSFEALRRFPDDEHRVYYVGATRARKSLFLVAPQSPRAYQF